MEDILGAAGFGDTSPVPNEETELCKKWIKEWIDFRKTVNYKCGSYGLKHAVERWSSKYIPNGAFIKAANDLGFNCERIGSNGVFNMSFVRAKKNNDISKLHK